MVGTFSPIPSFKLLQPVQGHDLALGAVNKLQGGYDGFSGYAVAVGEAVTDAVHDRILSQIKSGLIILCHDTDETKVDAMPFTLDDLKARGYQFATVTQLIQLEAESAKLSAPVVLQFAVVHPSFDFGATISLSVSVESKLRRSWMLSRDYTLKQALPLGKHRLES